MKRNGKWSKIFGISITVLILVAIAAFSYASSGGGHGEPADSAYQGFIKTSS